MKEQTKKNFENYISWDNMIGKQGAMTILVAPKILDSVRVT